VTFGHIGSTGTNQCAVAMEMALNQ